MHPKSPKLLNDIQEACAFIQEDIAGLSLEEFLADRRVCETVQSNFTVIGKPRIACAGITQRLPPAFAP